MRAACPLSFNSLDHSGTLQADVPYFQGNDGERVCVDQLMNPDSIVFLPGGAWDGNVVIQGHVGTASDSQLSQALMKRFQVAIKKSFTNKLPKNRRK